MMQGEGGAADRGTGVAGLVVLLHLRVAPELAGILWVNDPKAAGAGRRGGQRHCLGLLCRPCPGLRSCMQRVARWDHLGSSPRLGFWLSASACLHFQ